MNKLLNINCTSNSKVLKSVKPSMIYLPLIDKNNNIYEPIISEGEYVYKGDIIAINKINKFPIHSSVSGYYVYRNNKIISNGKISSCMVIENDYKEKYHKENIKKRKLCGKENFIKLLYANGISTYLKYKTDNVKYLLINGVECEPYVCSNKSVIFNYTEEILECIDNILDVMNIPYGIIVIKYDDDISYKKLIKYLGTYPNIKIFKTKHIYFNERVLIKNVLGITYNKYPSEKNIIVNNVSSIYAIYEALNYNRPLIEKVITIVIPNIKLNINIKVKVGTLASDIMKEIVNYDKIKNPLFIVGGLLNGNSLPYDDVVITKDVNSIFVIENNFEKSNSCIKCGKCMEICPADINPVIIMNNYNNIGKLNKSKLNKCTLCGLCSYICPSKIEVREFVRSAKEKVEEDEI